MTLDAVQKSAHLVWNMACNDAIRVLSRIVPKYVIRSGENMNGYYIRESNPNWKPTQRRTTVSAKHVTRSQTANKRVALTDT